MKIKNVLLTNVWLEKYQGSEMNCLSLAHALTQMGCSVEIATFLYEFPIKEVFEKEGLSVKNLFTQKLNRTHYDLIWAHHTVVLDHLLFGLGITADKIVFSSLSPFEPLEVPPAYANQLTLCLANSSETSRQLLSEGVQEGLCRVFPNSIAKADYESGGDKASLTLERLAIVSNHIPAELKESSTELMKRGIAVDIYGLGYQHVLMTPEILKQYDAVITIGRTVQYCMGLNIPVYCYDIHGGPGWLRMDQLEKAFDLNFSGRGFGKKTSEEIVKEVMGEFADAASETPALREFCAKYCILEKNLEEVFHAVEKSSCVNTDAIRRDFSDRKRENEGFLRLLREKLDTAERLNQHQRLEQEVLNKQGHIELLLQSERDLQREVHEYQEKENQLKASLTEKEEECQQLRNQGKELQASLTEKEDAYSKLEYALACREGECQQLRDKENQLKNALGNKETEYQQLQYELACREGECQQLRDKENRFLNELAAIKATRSWRLGQRVAKFARFFVPAGSKRAMLARIFVTMVKHPGKFCSCLTPKKLKKFFRLLRRGNMEQIQALVQMNITGQPVPSKLEVVIPQLASVDLTREKTAADYPVLTVPQWENPTVSIVIPVYNQFEYTYHCVESILKNSGDITYEIMIANDCSTDLTTEIEQIIPGVKCITNEKNLRFVLNCKNAAKYAKGTYLLFLNNDTQVQENWLEPLVTLIESADDIGMVGSKLIYPDGLLQEAGGIVWRDGSAWNFGNRQNPSLPEFNYVKEVDYISGAAIMLPRALWEEIGGFDETFVPAYCDDSDLAFTVRKKGYRVLYQPKSVVVHFEGVSNGTDTASGQKQYQIINSQKFYQKWKEVLASHPENGQNVFQARDRSYGKKTLLMVDHYVPQYDKDAGSRTVYQYLKLFVGLGFNVKFIGDNFFQHEPYTSVLQQMGIEVLYGPDYAAHWEDWIRDNGEHIDYVFLNRPHIAPRYMDTIRRYTNARIVYYGHDLGFLREMREYEVTGDISFKESSMEWQPKELAIMRKADMAYYPSYVEVNAIHAIDPEIRVKAIPAYLFDNVQWEGYDFAARKDIMFIGGFSHRPNVDAVKWLAKEILPELVKRMPDVKIHILGSNAPQEVLALANDHLIMEGFVTDEELEQFYRSCRISFVPLRYGAGIKGKVVEAMRFGTPVVTTSTGAEGIPNAEKAMLIEDDAAVLAEKLAALYQDVDALTTMSQNCISYIQENYSIKNAIKVISPEFDLQGKETHS